MKAFILQWIFNEYSQYIVQGYNFSCYMFSEEYITIR